MKIFISPRHFIFLAAVLLLSLITAACDDSNGNTPTQPQELTPIVYIADKDTAGVFELYISSQSGASIKKISGFPTAGQSIKIMIMIASKSQDRNDETVIPFSDGTWEKQ